MVCSLILFVCINCHTIQDDFIGDWQFFKKYANIKIKNYIVCGHAHIATAQNEET